MLDEIKEEELLYSENDPLYEVLCITIKQCKKSLD